MKRILTNLLMAAGIAGTLGVSTLLAQAQSAVADIPFAFVVSHRTMPAGRYTIGGISAGKSVFSVANHKGGVFTQLGVIEDGNPEHPSVTFARHNKTYLLVKVTPPNDIHAYALSSDSINRQLDYHMGMASMISIKLKAH